MLHEILSVEVRSGFILRSRGMDDGEFAVVKSIGQIPELRVKPKRAIELQRLGFGDIQTRARLVVVIVLDGRHQHETVCRAPEKDHNQCAAGVAIACDESVHTRAESLARAESGDRRPERGFAT